MDLKFIEQNLFIIFIILFSLFYIAVIKKDINKLFFFCCVLVIGFLIMNEKNSRVKKDTSNVKSFINDVENNLKHFQINYNKIFQVHKSPRSLKFIKQNYNISKLLFDLRFMETYDKGSFYTMIIYLEFFLKFHFNIMLGKYPFEHYFQTMKDMRNEILNISKAFVFSVPQRSILLKHINDLDKYIMDIHNEISYILDKYIQILKNKYNKQNHIIPDPPYPQDKHRQQYFELY